jgi:hypothetical protein
MMSSPSTIALDDQLRKLGVLVLDRLDRLLEGGNHEVEPVEGALLELLQVLLVLDARLVGHRRYPTFPVT